MYFMFFCPFWLSRAVSVWFSRGPVLPEQQRVRQIHPRLWVLVMVTFKVKSLFFSQILGAN